LILISRRAMSRLGQSQTAKRDHQRSLRDLVYLGIPVLGTIVVGSADLYGQAAGFSSGLETGTIDGTSAILLSLILFGVLCYGMKRFPEKSARILVAAITIVGTVSGLILLRTSLQASSAPPALFLITLPLGYLGLDWSVRGYFGSLSRRKATLSILASATLLGALIGTSLATIVSLTFLIVLTTLDVYIVESNSILSIVGKTNYDQVVSVVTLQLDVYAVGLGDFLAYSILSSTALRVLGLYGAIETSILILVGAAVTFEMTKRRGKAPGLLLPVVLGLIPVILGLLGI
jgi:hypothetical protein